MKHLTIRQFTEQYPNEKRFTVFRVSDKYSFTVKEIREHTVILNTKVNLEVSKDDLSYLVHETNLGLDFTLPKVFRYVPSELDKPVISINFRKEITTRLHNEAVFVFGRIIKETFYPFKLGEKTPDFNDKIIEVTYDYDFDPITKEAVYRLETIKWFNELGEVCATKELKKLYNAHLGMVEAKRRRANIIQDIKTTLDRKSKSTGDGQATAGLIGELKDAIYLYEEYGSYLILQVVEQSTNPLLEVMVSDTLNIRNWLKTKLNFVQVEQQNPNLYKGSLL